MAGKKEIGIRFTLQDDTFMVRMHCVVPKTKRMIASKVFQIRRNEYGGLNLEDVLGATQALREFVKSRRFEVETKQHIDDIAVAAMLDLLKIIFVGCNYTDQENE